MLIGFEGSSWTGLWILLFPPASSTSESPTRTSALDIAQASAPQVVYIENTPMFVQIAESLGIRSVLHTDYKSTRAKLASFGLQNNTEDIRPLGPRRLKKEN